ncbi:integrase [Flavipsychrobacter stenotrophus]|uniref:Integrase n=1 Tax=Flavipsychrobacter stenotrophus TaxID=2077091 RepID=A0A2S7SQJ8_9BACT|nr:tyrosine-type recombinase/integrase [Flavipsychrobacter stenotrophus]PQJ09179.1 integrase [Flavipsychrobacter stenotrophus]
MGSSGAQTNFIHYLKFEKRYSAHTISAYQQDLQQFFLFSAITFQLAEPALISHFHVRSWLADLKEKKSLPRTINRKISSLNSFYKYLLRLGLVDKNPVKLLHAQKLPGRLPVFLKESETINLFEEIDFGEGFAGATDRIICELLYATGMRRNELLQLKENDIEWSLKQIRVLGKGNKERLIPAGAALLDSIKDYLSVKKEQEVYDKEYLLNVPSGKPLYAGYVYRVVNKYLTQTTTLSKRSPHVLRHTFATHLLNNGANIQAIKDLLGHSSLAATQIYTHNSIDKLKEIHKQNHPRG